METATKIPVGLAVQACFVRADYCFSGRRTVILVEHQAQDTLRAFGVFPSLFNSLMLIWMLFTSTGTLHQKLESA